MVGEMIGLPGLPPTRLITVERLKNSDVFGSLPEPDLHAIAEFCSEETYREGMVVLNEGEAADKLFIVERGKLSLEKKVVVGRQSSARTATVGYLGPGKMVGFSTLTSPHVYSTSVLCVEPARVICVDGPTLRAYLLDHPAAGLMVMTKLSSMISERYRNANNTLTYFLSIIAHELRSPLAAIENYLQTLLGGFAGELTSKQNRMIQRCTLRLIDMQALIGDVVDLARMRPEQIQDDFEWFDPGEVGAESIEDVRLAAVEKEVRIKIEPPSQFSPIVGSRRRMRQVFTNLLNNAIKFSPLGGTVIFRAWYEPEVLIFEVEDQGPGIPAEDLPHIFKDFYRASNVEGTPGSGLGLSIAKKIMDAHDGQILIQNLEDETGVTGTRFTIRIPRNLKTPDMRRREWQMEEPERQV